MTSPRKWANPTGTSTYFAWRNMRYRCLNPKAGCRHNYAGRGIDICDRWLNDYDAFVADMGERPVGLSLDRVDNDKGYTPENCRWATTKTQSRNKRTNVLLSANGETKTVTEWAETLGVLPCTLHRRLRTYGMAPAKALTAASLVRPRRCGTRQGYAKGCRCKECKAAHAASCRKFRHLREARAKAAAA